MLIVDESSFIPKPSDEEIARVEAWQKVERFMAAQREAEKIMDKVQDRIHFMGHFVDESFSRLALIGMLHS